jgi:hypothetical protein
MDGVVEDGVDLFTGFLEFGSCWADRCGERMPPMAVAFSCALRALFEN